MNTIAECSGYNQLSLEVFSSGTTRIMDTDDDLARAESVSFQTFYPGGLYGAATVKLPRDVTRSLRFAGGQRLVIRNGLATVWEGEISSVDYAPKESEQHVILNGAGFWGQLSRRYLDKRWADQRLDNTIWRWKPDPLDANNNQFLANSGPDNRLRIIPKGVAWTASNYIYIEYTMPISGSVARMTFDAELAEGAQAWRLTVENATASIFSRGTSGCSNSQDIIFGTPTQKAYIKFWSDAAQTPIEDGTYFGEIRNLTVFDASASATMTQVVKDVQSNLSGIINTDTSQIASNTLLLAPFMTNGPEPADSVLLRATSAGDNSQNSWAAYFRESELAGTPDGKPVMVLEQQPALTDYDYAVRLDETNLVAPVDLNLDTSGISNYIIVHYRDPLFDAALFREFVLTPGDDASLKDSTSIASYGQRELAIDAGQATAATALNLGKKYLAALKNPKFYMSSPVSVRGYIRSKNGNPIPASQIRAGKRVKIENFLTDLSSISGAGLTFLVTRTNYTDESEQCDISASIPDDLAVILVQQTLGIISPQGSGGGGIPLLAGGAGGAGGTTTAQISEGPGIDLVDLLASGGTVQVGVGLDTILLAHANGSPATEYAATEAGLISALAAAVSGDVVNGPRNITLSITAGITVPTGVTVKNLTATATANITNNGGLLIHDVLYMSNSAQVVMGDSSTLFDTIVYLAGGTGIAVNIAGTLVAIRFCALAFTAKTGTSLYCTQSTAQISHCYLSGYRPASLSAGNFTDCEFVVDDDAGGGTTTLGGGIFANCRFRKTNLGTALTLTAPTTLIDCSWTDISGEANIAYGTGDHIPQNRTLTVPTPLLIAGGAAADLSADRTLTWAASPANTFLAGPTTGADAALTVRALVDADLPTMAKLGYLYLAATYV